MKKKLLIAVSAIAGLLVVVIAGAWLFLDANQFRPTLEEMMGNALGRKVTLGNIRVALLSGGIAVEDLAIADDPAFSRQPFVTAKAITVGVDLMPLIFSRSLRVETFRLERPQVALIRSASGTWNFSGLGASSSGSTANGTKTAMSVLVQKITIDGGRVTVDSSGSGASARTYEDVNMEATDLSYTSRFPFRVTGKTPGGGTITLEGKAGPFNMKDAADTPFEATVGLKQLDIATTGFIDPAAGIGGVIDFAGGLTSDGALMNTKGKVSATKVQLVRGSTPARVPIVVDYESTYDPKAQTGTLKQGDVHVGKALAHLTGSFNVGGKVPTVRMKLSGQKMPVTELEAALPAIGVTLPSGASLKQGTLDTDLAISGPIDRLVTAGPVNLSQGTLTGFDLGAKLGALAAFAGLAKGGDTVIEVLSAALRLAPEGMQVDRLNMIAPAIGTLTGDGTIAPKGAMEFKMLAKLKSGAAGVATGSMARVVSLGQTSGIPFKIQGTTSNPVFVPDVGGAVKNVGNQVKDVVKSPENAKKAAETIGGFFGRKKQ